MATCRDVIRDALLWRGVTDEDNDPTDAEASKALPALKGLYQWCIRARQLTPVAVSEDYTAGEDEAVFKIGAVVITLPETITVDEPIYLPDGTVTYTRQPRDRAVITISGATPEAYIYEAAHGQWINVHTLGLNSEAPFSSTLYDELVGRLTVSLRYPNIPLDPAAVAAGSRFEAAIKANVVREPLQAEYF